MRQGRGDAVEHALDVDVDHAVPVFHLAALERRVRHEARVIKDDVDAAVLLDCSVNEAAHLRHVGNIRADGSARGQRKLFGQLLNSLDPSCAQHQLRTEPGEAACRRFAQTAARASNDDHFAFDSIVHCSPCTAATLFGLAAIICMDL